MKALTASSLASLLLTSAAVAAHAGAAAGAGSFDFLTFDHSVRAAGLGGAYTALASDSSALFYNPAGLGRVKVTEAAFMHNQYAEGLTQEHVGLATRHGWGLNLNYLNFGGISRTRLDVQDGGIGSAGLTDMALGGGYGQPLSESISVGAGVKFIRETIDNVSASGFAVDAGVLADVPSLPGLSLGAALLNVGPSVRFQSQRENLPLLGRAGAAYGFRAKKTDNTVAFDLTKALADKVRFGFGAETVIEKLLALRLGFTSRNDAGIGITAGVGFIWKAMSVDFAFVPFGDLGSVNRLSLTFRWGNGAKRDSPPTERKEAALNEAPAPTPAVALNEAPAPAPAVAPEEAPSLPENEDLRRVRYNERMGRISFNKYDYASAKNFFAQAIGVATRAGVKAPVVADAYSGMGRCLLEEGNVGDAAKFFKAFEAGPSPETQLLVQEELETLHPKEVEGAPRPLSSEQDQQRPSTP